jgi:hypothetical protein
MFTHLYNLFFSFFKIPKATESILEKELPPGEQHDRINGRFFIKSVGTFGFRWINYGQSNSILILHTLFFGRVVCGVVVGNEECFAKLTAKQKFFYKAFMNAVYGRRGQYAAHDPCKPVPYPLPTEMKCISGMC